MIILKEDLFAKANAFASLRSRFRYATLEMTSSSYLFITLVISLPIFTKYNPAFKSVTLICISPDMLL